MRGVQELLGYLRALGVVPAAGSREAPTPAGELLDRYAVYLRLRRGLKASTIRNYTQHARDFLADCERLLGELALTVLDVAAISDYMLRESRRVSVSSPEPPRERAVLAQVPARGGRDRPRSRRRGADDRQVAAGFAGPSRRPGVAGTAA
jgi:hypothetical protein